MISTAAVNSTRDAAVERQRIASRQIAQQADHPWSERVSDLVDRGNQTHQHAERTRIELRCTISAGSVIRLPTEKPNSAQAAISAVSCAR